MCARIFFFIAPFCVLQDPMCEDGELRMACVVRLVRYLESISPAARLGPAEVATFREHVIQNDQPESKSTLTRWAGVVGLVNCSIPFEHAISTLTMITCRNNGELFKMRWW